MVIEVDLKYVTPVQEQRLFDGVPLYRKRPEHGEILEKLKKGIALSLEEGPFYELRLRSLFSDLWETIYTWAMDERMNQGVYDSREDERIKKILAYIQESYGEKITVEGMAQKAHISQRECYRLFQKGLDMSPVEYVISYRLQTSPPQKAGGCLGQRGIRPGPAGPGAPVPPLLYKYRRPQR